MTVSSRRTSIGGTALRPLRARLARPGRLAVLGAGILACLVAAAASAQLTPKTDDEKAFYTIGAVYAEQFTNLQPMSEREVELLIQGLRDALGGKPLAVDKQEGGQLVRPMAQARQERAIGREKSASAAYIAEQAARSGAKQTDSGLVYSVIESGDGASPSATDTVRVHYHGTLRDGTVFDSSVERGQPAEFPLNRVIPCWTEGVAMMKTGGKSRLVCPADIAYGDRGQGLIPGGAALTFEVELLDVVSQ